MTKDEAQVEAIRRWRELPLSNQITDNAPEFAKVLLPVLEFPTLGYREKIIAAWLVRDVESRKMPGQTTRAPISAPSFNDKGRRALGAFPTPSSAPQAATDTGTGPKRK